MSEIENTGNISGDTDASNDDFMSGGGEASFGSYDYDDQSGAVTKVTTTVTGTSPTGDAGQSGSSTNGSEFANPAVGDSSSQDDQSGWTYVTDLTIAVETTSPITNQTEYSDTPSTRTPTTGSTWCIVGASIQTTGPNAQQQVSTQCQRSWANVANAT